MHSIHTADGNGGGRPLGLRHTRQREAILQVIHETGGPLTVEEILQRAVQLRGRIGIATVYRNVKLLLEQELIRPVTLSDGQTRYEAAHLGHHHHFHCKVCGQVFDLELCPVKIPQGMLPQGFQVEEHELTLHGTCPRCQLPMKT